LNGTLLSADWMGPELDDRVANLKSTEDFRRLVRDFGATHAIVDVSDLEKVKFGPYVVKFGTPIARERDWVLYRLPPDFWLGPDLINQKPSSPNPARGADERWEINGISPERLYRVQMDLACKAPDDHFSVSVDFRTSSNRILSSGSRQIFCGTAGQITRLLDIVSPPRSARAIVHFWTDLPSAKGEVTAISFKQGYPVDEAWHFIP
jgi:hypothetical protein